MSTGVISFLLPLASHLLVFSPLPLFFILGLRTEKSGLWEAQTMENT